MSEVTPAPSASVMLLRDAPLEVLMLRRHENSSFGANAWVFPGGLVEDADAVLGDGSLLSTMRIAAARETFEESGVWLGEPLRDAEEKRRLLLGGEIAFGKLLEESPIDAERLVWTSRWITPIGVPKRFDTWFFLATVPRGTEVTVEQNELVDAIWIAPEAALERASRREMHMLFPTLRNLEAITGFSSAGSLMASRRGVTIDPIQPVLVDGKPTLL